MTSRPFGLTEGPDRRGGQDVMAEGGQDVLAAASHIGGRRRGSALEAVGMLVSGFAVRPGPYARRR